MLEFSSPGAAGKFYWEKGCLEGTISSLQH